MFPLMVLKYVRATKSMTNFYFSNIVESEQILTEKFGRGPLMTSISECLFYIKHILIYVDYLSG